jgi:hypothetical protein
MTEFPFYTVLDSQAGLENMTQLDEAISVVLGEYYQEDEFRVEVEDCGEDVGVTFTVSFRIYPDALAFLQHLQEGWGYRGQLHDALCRAKQNPADH